MDKEPNLGWTEVLGSAATSPAEPRGAGYPLSALGQTWTVSSLELGLKAQFEQWVRGNALRNLRLLEQDATPEEANALRSTYLGDLAAGLFNFDGRHCRTARGDLAGLQQLFLLVLKRCHPQVTIEQVGQMFHEDAFACGTALAWALGNSRTPAPRTETGATPNSSVEQAQLQAALRELQTRTSRAG